MNREILFKAKCITTGEWVEGDLKHGNYFEGDETVYIVKGLSNYPIDENTLCQFTGLYDRHGNKIWEKDIIRYIDEVINKEKEDLIVYDEVQASFLRLHEGPMGLQYLFFNKRLADRSEIIGNCVDNPEWLEKE